MPAARSFAAGYFQLTLDGLPCGFLKSVDGGAPVAEVVSEGGPSYFAKKHVGPIGYAPFVVQADLAMNNDLFDWINASWSGKYQRKNGAVVAADTRLVAVSQRDFFNALITETTMPSLDGSSKDPAYLTVTIAPEYTRNTKPSAKLAGATRVQQKRWLPANFRLTIDGVDCTKVRVVDSFTVKQSVASDDVGDARDYQKQPGRLEFPNLRITLPASSAATWFDWFDDFVIKGNNDDSKEKKGSISILSPDRVDELLRIDLFNLGIFRIGPDKAEANSDSVATVTAHVYCERMELHAAGAATKAVTAVKTVGAVKTAGARKAVGAVKMAGAARMAGARKAAVVKRTTSIRPR
jgi:hypothetical protein